MPQTLASQIRERHKPPLAAIAFLSNLRSGSQIQHMLDSVGVGIAGQLCLMVSGVVAARALGPEARGHFALLALVPTVICEIGALGVPGAVAYYVAKTGSREAALEHLTPIVATQVMLLWTLHVALCFWLFTKDPQLWHAAVATMLTIPVALSLQYSLAVLQGEHRFSSFNLIRILPVAGYSTIIATIWMWGGAHLVAVTVSWASAYLVAAVVAFRLLIKSRRILPTVSGKATICINVSITHLLSFGLRGLFGSNSLIQAFRLDQAYIAFVMTPTELGHYVVALSITNLPLLIGASIGVIAFPMIASGPKVAIAKQLFRAVAVVGVCGGGVTLVLFLTAPILIGTFFGDAFITSIPVARILLISGFFQACRRVLADSLRGAGLPEMSSWSELVGLSSLAAAVAFIPGHDLIKLGWALTASSASSLVFLCIVAALATRSSDTSPIIGLESPRHAI
jgi:O-antigen/teichoic acid export membrane protein